MTNTEAAAKAHEIQMAIISSPSDVSAQTLWHQILAISGQNEKDELSDIDFEHWSRLASDQLQEIVKTQPLPDDLRFAYFGLYDCLDGGDSTEKQQVGFYFAGGDSPRYEDAIENGDLSYFPAGRRIHLDLLNRIREEERRKPEKQRVFEWLLLLAAAAVLARSAITRVGVRVPTFVGFDSGDYLRVR